MKVLKRIAKKLKRELKHRVISPLKSKGKQKIFCIGRNKTGTTSLKKAFEDLEFAVGDQRRGEMLLREYLKGDFNSIIDYCKSAQVFQDFPFSFPETFKHLDKAYPGSKFILTLRDSPEDWYRSLVNFHSKRFGKGKTPTKEDLQNARYVWKGWVWECSKVMYEFNENEPYNKEMMIKHYMIYTQSVLDYFKDRPEDLIVINVGEKGSYQKLMEFLNIRSPHSDFPWENKTENISVK